MAGLKLTECAKLHVLTNFRYEIESSWQKPWKGIDPFYFSNYCKLSKNKLNVHFVVPFSDSEDYIKRLTTETPTSIKIIPKTECNESATAINIEDNLKLVDYELMFTATSDPDLSTAKAIIKCFNKFINFCCDFIQHLEIKEDNKPPFCKEEVNENEPWFKEIRSTKYHEYTSANSVLVLKLEYKLSTP